MRRKRLDIRVDYGRVAGIRVQNQYAEYDFDKKEVKGGGRGVAHNYATLPFEPTFDVVLYDKWRRIHSTAAVTYNGVFRETGQMYFAFKFSGIEPMDAGSIKMVLVAKAK